MGRWGRKVLVHAAREPDHEALLVTGGVTRVGPDDRVVGAVVRAVDEQGAVDGPDVLVEVAPDHLPAESQIRLAPSST